MVLATSVVVAAAIAGAQAAQQMAITFDKTAVVASGVTPGGSVVWFGVARERPSWFTRVVRFDFVTADTDGDGVVRLDIGHLVGRQSIWTAVDLASGAFVVATPQAMPRREVQLPTTSLQAGPRGGAEAFQDARQFVEILLVRPGKGAWALSAGDGGALDADRQPDGSIHAAFGSMRSIQASTATPDQALPGDIIVVVDPRRMEFYATTFGKPR